MPNVHQVPERWKAAMRGITESLRQQDRSAPFDRCIVGGGTCEEPPIQAHCIPRTMLGLLENQEKQLIGVTSQPPKNPAQWINDIHLKPIPTALFTASRWACKRHDALFNPIDSKAIDINDPRHLFLIAYRSTCYLTQRALHGGHRIAAPAFDPAVESPKGLTEDQQLLMNSAAMELSITAAKVMRVKWQMDKLLATENYDRLEYQVVEWQTKPAMAAVGMQIQPGKGYKPGPFGPDREVPTWMALLPQDHGQTIITAVPLEAERDAPDFHDFLKRNNGQPRQTNVSNEWTDTVCKHVFDRATDMAVSFDQFSKTSCRERDAAQEYLFLRNLDTPETAENTEWGELEEITQRAKQDLPNLLALE